VWSPSPAEGSLILGEFFLQTKRPSNSPADTNKWWFVEYLNPNASLEKNIAQADEPSDLIFLSGTPLEKWKYSCGA
jgi:hypothetical protein